jgi:hypothetical protein
MEKPNNKSRCKHCAYLYEGDNKSWCCDCYDKPIKEIDICNAIGEEVPKN